MHDKTVFITGGTTGIGRGAAERLVRQGARVVLLADDIAQAEILSSTWTQKYPGSRCEVVPCQLDSLASVDAAVRQIQETFLRVDVLLNAATSQVRDKSLSPDGLDLSFARNHLGHFALTTGLLDFMPPGARILNVSSDAHKLAMSFADPLFEARRYGAWRAHVSAALCSLLFTRLLAQNLRERNVGAFALHGGLLRSGRAFHDLDRVKVGHWLLRRFGVDATVGATTATWLASVGQIPAESGGYFRGERAASTSALARDEGAARQLWDLSERSVTRFRAARGPFG